MAYGEKDNETVENIVYDAATLSDIGISFPVRKVWVPKAKAWNPLYKTLLEPFSFEHYTAPRPPIDLGVFEIEEALKKSPRILRMTIKEVGENTVHLPAEVEHLQPFIAQVLEYEGSINEKLEHCEVHLTIDYGEVKGGQTQRFPGWHVDGLQGGKFKQKLMAEHSYIIATKNPTEFCLQPFFVKQYDEDITNFFKVFDQQARKDNIYRGLENHLYLMDAYMVHRTPVAENNITRGFARITIANAPLPIEHNTLNPMLKQKRPPFKHDIRDWLRAPDVPVDYSFYGLGEKLEEQEKISEEKLQEIRKSARQDIGTFSNEPLSVGKIIEIKKKNFPKVQKESPIYNDWVEEFNAFKYTTPRLPIDLGTAPVKNIHKCPNVLRMLLKWSGSNELRVPQELLPIKSLLERIFTYDKDHNPYFTDDVAHITIDTRVIEPGKTHRFPGFHGDDLQGGAFPKKDKIAHSYILTTDPGTEFCLQPFFVAHIDDSHERHFTEFDRQASEDNIFTVKGGHIYLMDPYCVHRTPLEAGEGIRTFLRITFSTKQMLLPHNTYNPMFKEEQNSIDNTSAPHLNETWFTQASDKEIPYSFYGLEKVE